MVCSMNAIIKRKADSKIPSSIDIQCEISALSFDDISKAAHGEPSSAICERINKAYISPRLSATVTLKEATGLRGGYNQSQFCINITTNIGQ